MRLARSLKIALVVMVILGTLFAATPGYAWRGHHYWHGGWGFGFYPYWGGYYYPYYGYNYPYYPYYHHYHRYYYPYHPYRY